MIDTRKYSASAAPESAPIVVAISRNIPTRMLEYPSRTYAAAAPEDVAITDTSAAPMAYRMSTPNSSVSIGTITTPPPNPVSAPKNPASSDPKPINAVNSSVVNRHSQIKPRHERRARASKVSPRTSRDKDRETQRTALERHAQ